MVFDYSIEDKPLKELKCMRSNTWIIIILHSVFVNKLSSLPLELLVGTALKILRLVSILCS